MKLHNISVISHYESILLTRSWLFKIFAVLSVLLIIISHLISHSSLAFSWNITAMASSIPYLNAYVFNIIQSFIAIFLAGNFMKRDSKLDTAEVTFVRPMSNADYIIGKTLGIVKVFAMLNIGVMLIGAFFNLFASPSPFNGWYYLFYFFTLTIPSLLFVLGLSFVMMSVLKNQAVTFVVMLGVVGCTLFYAGNTQYGTFDFFASTLANTFSDITGHAALVPYLTHRLGFLSIGLGFLVMTVALIARIPHHPRKKPIFLTSGLLVVLFGVGVLYQYWNGFDRIRSLRNDYKAVYEECADMNNLYAESHAISFSQKGKHITLQSTLTLQNRSGETLQEWPLFLNPGLKVSRLTVNGFEVNYKRNKQLILVNRPTADGERLKVDLQYGGVPDEYICFPDIEDDFYFDTNTKGGVMRYGKHYLYAESHYTLLTPEGLWYPVSAQPVNPEYPFDVKKNFTRYTLYVENPHHRTVITQGHSEALAEAISSAEAVAEVKRKKFFDEAVMNADSADVKIPYVLPEVDFPKELLFEADYPLTGISLTMGAFERRSIDIDSLSVELYLFPGHDIYTDVFPDLADTLQGYLKATKSQYEVNHHRDYPFDKLLFAETPISFFTYSRTSTGHSEFNLPEIIYLPERGATIGNFRYQIKSMLRFSKNGAMSFFGGSQEPEDIELMALGNLLDDVLFSETIDENGGGRFSVSSPFSTGTLTGGGFEQVLTLNNRDISALYFTHALSIQSEEFPAVDVMMNIMLKQEENSMRAQWMRQFFGMSDSQRASEYLNGHSFVEALSDKELKEEVLYEVIKLKGLYLRNYVTSSVSFEDFFAFTKAFAERHNFEEISFSDFNREFEKQFGYGLIREMNDWYNTSSTPIVMIKGVQCDQAEIEEHTRYMTSFGVYNPSEEDAVISITLEERNQGRGPGGGQDRKPPVNYIIPAGEKREIRMRTDDRPNQLSINSNIAQNLPTDFIKNFQRVSTTTTDTMVGCFPLTKPIFEDNPKEVIVDNESEGFSVLLSAKMGKLQSWVKRNEKQERYQNHNRWRAPGKWTATVSANFYGDYINSSFYKRSGSGNNCVEWKADLQKAGFYEVYIYNPTERRWGRGMGGGRRQPDAHQLYTIYHSDGSEEVKLDMEDDKQSWLLVGSFFFNEGEARVVLSDIGSYGSQAIYADAVKWVYAKNNKNK